MSVDFLITYDSNSKDYLFYSDNKDYKTVVIRDIFQQEIVPFAPVYTSCAEDEMVVEPGITYYIYDEETDSYKEVENPQGSPYEDGYYRLLENTVNSLCNTSVITEVFELQDSGHNQIELDQAPQDIKLFVASVDETQVGCSVNYSGKNVEITFAEQINKPIRFQINYVIASEIEENVEYEITLIKEDSTTETTTLICVLVADFLCLGDYETYLGVLSEDTSEVPEEITVEEVSENLYSASVLIDIIYDENETIEYRYKLIFGTQGNTQEYLCYARYTVLQGRQVGYIGDLTILTNPGSTPGDFPFLIVTTDEESILYTRVGGTYVLEVSPYNLIEVPSLTGGTLLSFGNREEQYVLSSDTTVVSSKTYYELISGEYVEVENPGPNDNPSTLGWYELEVIVKNNYGIGINSSDTAMGLPARAISLFETNIHPERPVKVSYKMRGILGTLPNNLEMAGKIKPNMINTQGIYTDNMYIGDSSQYLAFYTNKDTQKKQLAIQAEKIMIKGEQSTFSIGESIDILNEVVSPLDWAESHGRYSLSTDTEVQEGKMYFCIKPDEKLQRPYCEDNPTTISGITYVTNEDGSITANGTATADSAFGVKRQNWEPYMELETEEYKLTGCPQGGSSATYSLYATYGSGQGTSNPKYGTDTGSGAVFTGRTGQRTGVWIEIKNGTTVSDLVFRPSLKLNVDESYELVTNPTGNPSEHDWYELTSVDEAVSNYVATHLALTGEGLYVQTDREEGWRVLIKGDGVYIIDDEGAVVAEYKGEILLGKKTENNVLINENGLAIRNGLSPLATFSSDTIVLGKQTNAHTQIASDGVRLYCHDWRLINRNTYELKLSPNGVNYLKNDIQRAKLGWTGEEWKQVPISSGAAYFETEWTVVLPETPQYIIKVTHGWNQAYEFESGVANTYVTYIDEHDGVIYLKYELSYDGDKTISHVQVIHEPYVGYDIDDPWYYVKWRTSTQAEGAHFICGENDYEQDAGRSSFICGDGLIAKYDRQAVFGSFNVNNPSSIIEVGNGKAENNRSTAFTVNSDGTVITYPTSTSSGYGVSIIHGHNNKNTSFYAERTDTSTSVHFGIGAGGYNHGVYSNTLKKWLIYGDNNYVYVNGARMDTYMPSVSVTASTGNFVSATARQYGKIVQLSVKVYNPNSVASGGNIFVGTLNTTALRPAIWSTGVTYKGSYAIVGSVGTTGVITVRNSDSRVHNNGDDISIVFTYLVP